MDKQKTKSHLYTLKSYHETALDNWNSTAQVLLEAVNRGQTEEERRHLFVQTIMELTEVAHTNATRRANVLKAACVILNSL